MARSRDDSFCPVCRSITFEALSDPEGLKLSDECLRTPWWECQLCHTFSFEEKLWDRENFQENFRLFLGTKEGSRYKSLCIADNGVDPPDVVRFYHLFTDEGDPAVAAGIRILRKPEAPSSARSLEITRSWISECLSNHECSSSINSTYTMADRPARLIDLYAFGTEASEDVNLVDTAGLSVFSYATLSYCWGKGMPEDKMTTTANFSARQHRLDSTRLPQTLRDAFAVTRGLGIRYLWIDALCIIQDSVGDWERESAKMSSIYGQGLVSISAATAEDCTEGFLSPRDKDDNPCIDHVIRLQGQLKDGRSTCLYLWERSLCDCYISKIQGLQETALAKRGWAYQERFLAPRILHYAGSQILWECRQLRGQPVQDVLMLREAGPSHDIPPIFSPLARSILGPQGPDTRPSADELRRRWYSDVVPEFTRRHLSQASDKLPAISGIARAFHGCLGSDERYLAGLWLGDISYALSWSSAMAVNRPPFYRAPTFSWAATDGVVHYEFDPRRTESTRFVTLEDYGVELAGEDPFGCVKGGWIGVVGFLGRGTVFGSDDLGHYSRTSDIEDELVCDSSTKSLGSPFFDEHRYVGETRGWAAIYLPLYTIKPNWMFCLLLKESSDLAAGTYSRIGIVVGRGLDVEEFDESWFAEHCVRTSLTIV